MKNQRFCSGLLKTALLLLCFPVLAGADKKDTGTEMSGLKEKFQNPPAEFRPAPLWVWNTDVTRADIDRMLSEFAQAGFGGVFIHPRPGLITEYLSDDWFELYEYSCEQAGTLGLDVWIYDENSYPSGFAGGHVPDLMPESFDRGQGLAVEKVNLLPDDLSEYFVCLKKESDGFVETAADDASLKRPGDYRLYRKTYYRKSDWYGGFSYVDLLADGTTGKFIDVTMEGYEKHLKERLGDGIKGIFTDEPNIVGSGGMRWTPDLFGAFRQRWGYDLLTRLPLLEEETGNYREVRHNYMETLLEMFVDRWSKPYSEYAEKHNLIWTGHYWEHGWPDMSQGPDNMAMYAWHRMPGIDMLFNRFDEVSPKAQFGNVRSVKELRSAANQMGYKRTLCETYGGGGWDVTFRDMKRLGDWEYVLGVNFMNQHLSHMTLVGSRKYDYPPVFTPVSPWWSDYGSLNDYFARLSLVLSEGEQYNDVLVIEPTTTVWMYWNYYKKAPELADIGNGFQAFVTALEKNQVEYDLGSENIIKDHGSVKDNLFTVGQRSYRTVVIPPMTENLNAATFDLVKEFLANGGRLICYSHLDRVDGKANEELKNLLAPETGRVIHRSEFSPQHVSDDFHNDRIRFSDVSGSGLYHHRRTYGDGELLFAVNSSMVENAAATIALKGRFLYEMNPADGKYYEYPFRREGESVKFEIDLPPAGSVLLFSPAKRLPALLPAYRFAGGGRVLKTDNELSIARLRENVLVIDFCDLEIDGQAKGHLHVCVACDTLFRQFGFRNGNPWNSAVQFKRGIVEKDNFRSGVIKVRYRFGISEDFDMNGLRLAAEQPGIWKVRVNGIEATAIPGETWLDARFGVYAIGSHVRKGLNTVELYTEPMSIYAETEPVYIIGDFALESSDAGWEMKAPVKEFHLGSWREQGQPFYSWDMSYSRNYHIEDPGRGYAVQLRDWNGTLAEVWVNGAKTGIIAYAPYCLEVTPYLVKGDNKIEIRVVGSLKNLLGPHYTDVTGIAGPGHWKRVAAPIAGKDYAMSDYGLNGDFELVASCR